MYSLTSRLWFKVIALVVLETFLLTMSDITWAADYHKNHQQEQAYQDQKVKNNNDKLSSGALNNQIVLTQPAMPYMGFENITRHDGMSDISLIDTTIQGLTIAGNDLPDVFRNLKSNGCTVSEAGFGALRQGFNKKDIYNGLLDAGYDKEEVKTLLGTLLREDEERKDQAEKTTVDKTGPPQEEEESGSLETTVEKPIFEIPAVTELPVEKNASRVVERSMQERAVLRQTVEFVRLMINEGKRGKDLIDVLKKAGLSNERIITALSQVGFNLKDIILIFKEANVSCADIVQSLRQAQVLFSDKDIYSALLNVGYSDNEIIAAFKAAGISAEDILKLTTELGRDMVRIANAMVGAGYSTAEVAKAYLLKAMKWTWDQTVNVVNCAVKAFDAFLNNINRRFSSREELAYELVLDDILATGEVEITNNDVMTSMSAIKNVAQKYGVDMQGYNLSLESLMELSGMAMLHLDGDHWVTLVSIDGDDVTIIDNGEKKVISLKELKIRWDGNTLSLNQDKLKFKQLLDLQMREIRGGRGILGIIGMIIAVIITVIVCIYAPPAGAAMAGWLLGTTAAVAAATAPILVAVCTALAAFAMTFTLTLAANMAMGMKFSDAFKGALIAGVIAGVCAGAGSYISSLKGAAAAAPATGGTVQGAGNVVQGTSNVVSNLSTTPVTSFSSFMTSVSQSIGTNLTQQLVTAVTKAVVGQVVSIGVQYLGHALGLDQTPFGRIMIAVVGTVAAAYAAYKVGSWVNSYFNQSSTTNQGNQNSNNTTGQADNQGAGQQPTGGQPSQPVTPQVGVVNTGASSYNSVPYSIMNTNGGLSFNWNALAVSVATTAAKAVTYEICVANGVDVETTSVIQSVVGLLAYSASAAAFSNKDIEIKAKAADGSLITTKTIGASDFAGQFGYYFTHALPSAMKEIVGVGIQSIGAQAGWDPAVTSAISSGMGTLTLGAVGNIMSSVNNDISLRQEWGKLILDSLLTTGVQLGVASAAKGTDLSVTDLQLFASMMITGMEATFKYDSTHEGVPLASDPARWGKVIEALSLKMVNLFSNTASLMPDSTLNVDYNMATSGWNMAQFADHLVNRNTWQQRDKVSERTPEYLKTGSSTGEVSFWDAWTSAMKDNFSSAVTSDLGVSISSYTATLSTYYKVISAINELEGKDGVTVDAQTNRIIFSLSSTGTATLTALFKDFLLQNANINNFKALLAKGDIADVTFSRQDLVNLLCDAETYTVSYHKTTKEGAKQNEVSTNLRTYTKYANGTDSTVTAYDVAEQSLQGPANVHTTTAASFLVQATMVLNIGGKNVQVEIAEQWSGAGVRTGWVMTDAVNGTFITSSATPDVLMRSTEVSRVKEGENTKVTLQVEFYHLSASGEIGKEAVTTSTGSYLLDAKNNLVPASINFTGTLPVTQLNVLNEKNQQATVDFSYNPFTGEMKMTGTTLAVGAQFTTALNERVYTVQLNANDQKQKIAVCEENKTYNSNSPLSLMISNHEIRVTGTMTVSYDLAGGAFAVKGTDVDEKTGQAGVKFTVINADQKSVGAFFMFNDNQIRLNSLGTTSSMEILSAQIYAITNFNTFVRDGNYKGQTQGAAGGDGKTVGVNYITLLSDEKASIWIQAGSTFAIESNQTIFRENDAICNQTGRNISVNGVDLVDKATGVFKSGELRVIGESIKTTYKEQTGFGISNYKQGTYAIVGNEFKIVNGAGSIENFVQSGKELYFKTDDIGVMSGYTDASMTTLMTGFHSEFTAKDALIGDQRYAEVKGVKFDNLGRIAGVAGNGVHLNFMKSGRDVYFNTDKEGTTTYYTDGTFRQVLTGFHSEFTAKDALIGDQRYAEVKGVKFDNLGRIAGVAGNGVHLNFMKSGRNVYFSTDKEGTTKYYTNSAFNQVLTGFHAEFTAKNVLLGNNRYEVISGVNFDKLGKIAYVAGRGLNSNFMESGKSIYFNTSVEGVTQYYTDGTFKQVMTGYHGEFTANNVKLGDSLYHVVIGVGFDKLGKISYVAGRGLNSNFMESGKSIYFNTSAEGETQYYTDGTFKQVMTGFHNEFTATNVKLGDSLYFVVNGVGFDKLGKISCVAGSGINYNFMGSGKSIYFKTSAANVTQYYTDGTFKQVMTGFHNEFTATNVKLGDSLYYAVTGVGFDKLGKISYVAGRGINYNFMESGKSIYFKTSAANVTQYYTDGTFKQVMTGFHNEFTATNVKLGDSLYYAVTGVGFDKLGRISYVAGRGLNSNFMESGKSIYFNTSAKGVTQYYKDGAFSQLMTGYHNEFTAKNVKLGDSLYFVVNGVDFDKQGRISYVAGSGINYNFMGSGKSIYFKTSAANDTKYYTDGTFKQVMTGYHGEFTAKNVKLGDSLYFAVNGVDFDKQGRISYVAGSGINYNFMGSGKSIYFKTSAANDTKYYTDGTFKQVVTGFHNEFTATNVKLGDSLYFAVNGVDFDKQGRISYVAGSGINYNFMGSGKSIYFKTSGANDTKYYTDGTFKQVMTGFHNEFTATNVKLGDSLYYAVNGVGFDALGKISYIAGRGENYNFMGTGKTVYFNTSNANVTQYFTDGTFKQVMTGFHNEFTATNVKLGDSLFHVVSGVGFDSLGRISYIAGRGESYNFMGSGKTIYFSTSNANVTQYFTDGTFKQVMTGFHNEFTAKNVTLGDSRYAEITGVTFDTLGRLAYVVGNGEKTIKTAGLDATVNFVTDMAGKTVFSDLRGTTKTQLSYDTNLGKGTLTQSIEIKLKDGQIVQSSSGWALNGSTARKGDSFVLTSNGKTYVFTNEINGQLMPVTEDKARLASTCANYTTIIDGKQGTVVKNGGSDYNVIFVRDINDQVVAMKGDARITAKNGIEYQGVVFGFTGQSGKADSLLIVNGNNVYLSENDLTIVSAKAVTVTTLHTGMYEGKDAVSILPSQKGEGTSSRTQNIIDADVINGEYVVSAKQVITLSNSAWVLTEGDILNNISKTGTINVLSADGVTRFDVSAGVRGEVSDGRVTLTAGVRAVDLTDKDIVVTFDTNGNLFSVASGKGENIGFTRANLYNMQKAYKDLGNNMYLLSIGGKDVLVNIEEIRSGKSVTANGVTIAAAQNPHISNVESALSKVSSIRADNRGVMERAYDSVYTSYQLHKEGIKEVFAVAAVSAVIAAAVVLAAPAAISALGIAGTFLTSTISAGVFAGSTWLAASSTIISTSLLAYSAATWVGSDPQGAWQDVKDVGNKVFGTESNGNMWITNKALGAGYAIVGGLEWLVSTGDAATAAAQMRDQGINMLLGRDINTAVTTMDMVKVVSVPLIAAAALVVGRYVGFSSLLRNAGDMGLQFVLFDNAISVASGKGLQSFSQNLGSLGQGVALGLVFTGGITLAGKLLAETSLGVKLIDYAAKSSFATANICSGWGVARVLTEMAVGGLGLVGVGELNSLMNNGTLLDLDTAVKYFLAGAALVGGWRLVGEPLFNAARNSVSSGLSKMSATVAGEESVTSKVMQQLAERIKVSPAAAKGEWMEKAVKTTERLAYNPAQIAKLSWQGAMNFLTVGPSFFLFKVAIDNAAGLAGSLWNNTDFEFTWEGKENKMGFLQSGLVSTLNMGKLGLWLGPIMPIFQAAGKGMTSVEMAAEQKNLSFMHRFFVEPAKISGFLTGVSKGTELVLTKGYEIAPSLFSWLPSGDEARGKFIQAFANDLAFLALLRNPQKYEKISDAEIQYLTMTKGSGITDVDLMNATVKDFTMQDRFTVVRSEKGEGNLTSETLGNLQSFAADSMVNTLSFDKVQQIAEGKDGWKDMLPGLEEKANFNAVQDAATSKVNQTLLQIITRFENAAESSGQNKFESAAIRTIIRLSEYQGGISVGDIFKGSDVRVQTFDMRKLQLSEASVVKLTSVLRDGLKNSYLNEVGQNKVGNVNNTSLTSAEQQRLEVHKVDVTSGVKDAELFDTTSDGVTGFTDTAKVLARDGFIDTVASARLVNEKTEAMRRENLGFQELGDIIGTPITEGETAKSIGGREVSTLDKAVAKVLFTEKMRNECSVQDVLNLRESVQGKPNGEVITVTLQGRTGALVIDLKLVVNDTVRSLAVVELPAKVVAKEIYRISEVKGLDTVIEKLEDSTSDSVTISGNSVSLVGENAAVLRTELKQIAYDAKVQLETRQTAQVYRDLIRLEESSGSGTGTSGMTSEQKSTALDKLYEATTKNMTSGERKEFIDQKLTEINQFEGRLTKAREAMKTDFVKINDAIKNNAKDQFSGVEGEYGGVEQFIAYTEQVINRTTITDSKGETKSLTLRAEQKLMIASLLNGETISLKTSAGKTLGFALELFGQGLIRGKENVKMILVEEKTDAVSKATTTDGTIDYKQLAEEFGFKLVNGDKLISEARENPEKMTELVNALNDKNTIVVISKDNLGHLYNQLDNADLQTALRNQNVKRFDEFHIPLLDRVSYIVAGETENVLQNDPGRIEEGKAKYDRFTELTGENGQIAVLDTKEAALKVQSEGKAAIYVNKTTGELGINQRAYDIFKSNDFKMSEVDRNTRAQYLSEGSYDIGTGESGNARDINGKLYPSQGGKIEYERIISDTDYLICLGRKEELKIQTKIDELISNGTTEDSQSVIDLRARQEALYSTMEKSKTTMQTSLIEVLSQGPGDSIAGGSGSFRSAMKMLSMQIGRGVYDVESRSLSDVMTKDNNGNSNFMSVSDKNTQGIAADIVDAYTGRFSENAIKIIIENAKLDGKISGVDSQEKAGELADSLNNKVADRTVTRQDVVAAFKKVGIELTPDQAKYFTESVNETLAAKGVYVVGINEAFRGEVIEAVKKQLSAKNYSSEQVSEIIKEVNASNAENPETVTKDGKTEQTSRLNYFAEGASENKWIVFVNERGATGVNVKGKTDLFMLDAHNFSEDLLIQCGGRVVREEGLKGIQRHAYADVSALDKTLDNLGKVEGGALQYIKENVWKSGAQEGQALSENEAYEARAVELIAGELDGKALSAQDKLELNAKLLKVIEESNSVKFTTRESVWSKVLIEPLKRMIEDAGVNNDETSRTILKSALEDVLSSKAEDIDILISDKTQTGEQQVKKMVENIFKEAESLFSALSKNENLDVVMRADASARAESYKDVSKGLYDSTAAADIQSGEEAMAFGKAETPSELISVAKATAKDILPSEIRKPQAESATVEKAIEDVFANTGKGSSGLAKEDIAAWGGQFVNAPGNGSSRLNVSTAYTQAFLDSGNNAVLTKDDEDQIMELVSDPQWSGKSDVQKIEAINTVISNIVKAESARGISSDEMESQIVASQIADITLKAVNPMLDEKTMDMAETVIGFATSIDPQFSRSATATLDEMLAVIKADDQSSAFRSFMTTNTTGSIHDMIVQAVQVLDNLNPETMTVGDIDTIVQDTGLNMNNVLLLKDLRTTAVDVDLSDFVDVARGAFGSAVDSLPVTAIDNAFAQENGAAAVRSIAMAIIDSVAGQAGQGAGVTGSILNDLNIDAALSDVKKITDTLVNAVGGESAEIELFVANSILPGITRKQLAQANKIVDILANAEIDTTGISVTGLVTTQMSPEQRSTIIAKLVTNDKVDEFTEAITALSGEVSKGDQQNVTVILDKLNTAVAIITAPGIQDNADKRAMVTWLAGVILSESQYERLTAANNIPSSGNAIGKLVTDQGEVMGLTGSYNSDRKQLVLYDEKTGKEVAAVTAEKLGAEYHSQVAESAARIKAMGTANGIGDVAGDLADVLTANKGNIYLIKSNEYNIRGFANKDGDIFISEALWNDMESRDIVLAHESGEAAGIDHTDLRGCGKDVRNAIASILDTRNMDTIATPRQFINAINELLDGKQVSKAEAVLIERNWEQSGGVKDISLAYGIQDRLFGAEANQALTAKISGMESGAGTISPETAAALFETTPTTVESGIEDFKAAGKGEPQNQAAVYRSSGDNFKKAAESWEKAAQISPVLTPLAAAAYFNSALAYVRAGTDEDVVKAQSSFDKFSTIMKQLISEAGASFAPAQLQDAYLRYSGKPAGEILRETSMEPNAQAGVSGKVLFTAQDGRSAMGAVNGTVRTNNAGEEELVLSSPDKPGQEIILPIAANSVDSDTLDQVKAKLIEQFGSRQASASLSDSDREIAGKIIAGIGAEGADVRIIADNAQNIFGYAQSGTGIFIAQSLLESAEQTDKSQGTLVSAMGIFLASGELATTHIELYGCGKDVRNAVSTIDMSTMKTPEQFISAINAKMPAGKQVTGEEAALIEKNWKSASDADNSGAILGLQDRLFGKEANTRFETVLKSVATKPRQNDSLIEEVGLDASKKTELQVALLDGLTQVTERTTKDMVKTLEQGGVAGLKSL